MTGVYEVLAAGDDEARVAKQAEVDKLNSAIYDVRDKHGQWLFGAKDIDGFNDRAKLAFTSICQTIEPHMHARTGVHRRVLKALEREWRERQAAKTEDSIGQSVDAAVSNAVPGAVKMPKMPAQHVKGPQLEGRRRQGAGGEMAPGEPAGGIIPPGNHLPTNTSQVPSGGAQGIAGQMVPTPPSGAEASPPDIGNTPGGNMPPIHSHRHQACWPGCHENEDHVKKVHKDKKEKEAGKFLDTWRHQNPDAEWPDSVKKNHPGEIERIDRSKNNPPGQGPYVGRWDDKEKESRRRVAAPVHPHPVIGDFMDWAHHNGYNPHDPASVTDYGHDVGASDEHLDLLDNHFGGGHRFGSRYAADKDRSSRYAVENDHPVMHLQETYHPSAHGEKLIPKGNFHSYQDSVDQGGPEKVQHAFEPGSHDQEHHEDGGHNFVGDHSARRRQADEHSGTVTVGDRLDHPTNGRGTIVGVGGRSWGGKPEEEEPEHGAYDLHVHHDNGANAHYHAWDSSLKHHVEPRETFFGPSKPQGMLPGMEHHQGSRYPEYDRIARMIYADDATMGGGNVAPPGPPAGTGGNDMPSPGGGGATDAGMSAPAPTSTAPSGNPTSTPVTPPMTSMASREYQIIARMIEADMPGAPMPQTPNLVSGNDPTESSGVGTANGPVGISNVPNLSSQGMGVPTIQKPASRHYADRNYLQQADEAITKVLNEKAEEFQNTIAPLQQALVTIQQAEQLQNPLNVSPPAGTVNVLPQQQGQQPDPTGGQAPQGGGGLGADPAAAGLAAGGGAAQPPPQQQTARRRRREDGGYPKG